MTKGRLQNKSPKFVIVLETVYSWFFDLLMQVWLIAVIRVNSIIYILFQSLGVDRTMTLKVEQLNRFQPFLIATSGISDSLTVISSTVLFVFFCTVMANRQDCTMISTFLHLYFQHNSFTKHTRNKLKCDFSDSVPPVCHRAFAGSMNKGSTWTSVKVYFS